MTEPLRTRIARAIKWHVSFVSNATGPTEVDGIEDAADTVLALIREEDAVVLEALKAMVDRWEPDCGGKDRIMWENAKAAIAILEARKESGR